MKDPKSDHIVSVPPIFNSLKYLQIFLSVCILGLSAYGISVIVDLPAASLAIFTSLATVIINVWYFVSSKKVASLYNPIVVLILECILFIWWLATWAELLEWSVAYAYSDGCYVGRCVKKRTIIFSWDSYRDSVAAAGGASILNFMLVIITLVIYSKRFHLHRKAGAPFASFGKWGNGELNGSGAGGPRVAAPAAAQSQYQDQSGDNKMGVGQSVQAVPSQYGDAPQQPMMQAQPGPIQVQQMQTPTGTPTPIYQQGFPPPGTPGSPQPMMVQGQPQVVSRPVTMIAQPMPQQIQQMPQGQFVPQQQPQQFVPQQQPQQFVPQQQPQGQFISQQQRPMFAPVMMGPPVGQQYQMMPQQQQFAPSPPQMMAGTPPPQQGYWQPQGQMQSQQQQVYPQNMAYAPPQQPMHMQYAPARQVSPVPTPPPMQPPPGGMAASRGPPSPIQGNVAMAEPPSPIQHPAATELPAGGQQQQQQHQQWSQ